MENLAKELKEALAHRDAVLDTMLGLKEYAPMSRKRTALNTFLLTGHQEQGQPLRLRKAQERVLELID